MSRSLNKAQLIGNLTRDPEQKFTPQGTAITTFSIATNRSWNDSSGQKREEVDFHRIVTWSKLAEICGQFLVKGSKVFIEGRISNRKWKNDAGEDRNVTEIVASEMIILDSKKRNNDTTDAPPEPPMSGDQASDVQDVTDEIPF